MQKKTACNLQLSLVKNQFLGADECIVVVPIPTSTFVVVKGVKEAIQ